MVERHLTLDRAMWGSDHAASLEPNGMTRLIRDIRLVETAFGDGQKRLLDAEVPIMKNCVVSVSERLPLIDALAMDIDGVLTDGTFWLDSRRR